MAGDPTLTSLKQISPTTVRVTWSPPSEGATVTGYVVHYIGGGSNGTVTEPSSSTSTDITGLTSGPTYAISVEATSQHLSGESGVMTIVMGELMYMVLSDITMFSITPYIHTHTCTYTHTHTLTVHVSTVVLLTRVGLIL